MKEIYPVRNLRPFFRGTKSAVAISNGIYLDYAATTPVDERVKRVMELYWSKEFGNPSSLHKKGVAAKKALEESRKNIARVFHCAPSEIIFTGSGTEAINLGIMGAAWAHTLQGRHIITTRIEHHAVLRSCEELGREGFEITYLDVDQHGLIDPAAIARAIRDDTILISVMYANNEIGTIEPIAEIGKVIKEVRRKRTAGKNNTPIYFFTDACQAAGALDLNVEKLGIDLLAINGSKIYGPKGIGCLYMRRGVKIEPLHFGGGQERGLRSGTENIPAIVGLAKALEIAEKIKQKENARLTKLRNWFIGEILKRIPNAILNGHAISRLPNNINISLPDRDGETAVLYLDAKGIYCSTGSACSSVALEPSHVIAALGISPEYTNGSLRFTLGRKTTKRDLEYVVKVLVEVVKKLQKR